MFSKVTRSIFARDATVVGIPCKVIKLLICFWIGEMSGVLLLRLSLTEVSIYETAPSTRFEFIRERTIPSSFALLKNVARETFKVFAA
jgi:hypothetical protein